MSKLFAACGDPRTIFGNTVTIPQLYAGVCDASGVVLGLMPHPENHVIARQYPGFTHGVPGALGLTLFEQGVRYAKER